MSGTTDVIAVIALLLSVISLGWQLLQSGPNMFGLVSLNPSDLADVVIVATVQLKKRPRYPSPRGSRVRDATTKCARTPQTSLPNWWRQRGMARTDAAI